jgi:hypothetical protein
MFDSIRSRSTIMLGVSRSSSVEPILGAYMVGGGDAVGGWVEEERSRRSCLGIRIVEEGRVAMGGDSKYARTSTRCEGYRCICKGQRLSHSRLIG